jgi:hypothetical protein
MEGNEPGWWHVAKVVREGKRFAWLEYSGLGLVRETRSKTLWRFPTEEAAKAKRDEMFRDAMAFLASRKGRTY